MRYLTIPRQSDAMCYKTFPWSRLTRISGKRGVPSQWKTSVCCRGVQIFNSQNLSRKRHANEEVTCCSPTCLESMKNSRLYTNPKSEQSRNKLGNARKCASVQIWCSRQFIMCAYPSSGATATFDLVHVSGETEADFNRHSAGIQTSVNNDNHHNNISINKDNTKHNFRNTLNNCIPPKCWRAFSIYCTYKYYFRVTDLVLSSCGRNIHQELVTESNL